MLTKSNKVVMYILSIVTIILGLVTAIPFRTLPFLSQCENVLSVEFIVKFIIIPLCALGVCVFPNIIKYKQIKNREERSKVANILSYLPVLVVIVGLLVLVVHTLTFEKYPMSAGAHSTLLAICVCYLVFMICVLFVVNRITVSLSRKSNYVFDVIVGASLVVFVLLSWRILDSYAASYGLADGYLYGESNFDPYLFFLYIILLFVTVFYLKGLFRIIQENETLVYSSVLSNEQIDEIICEEYNHAYNDILNEFEGYFAEEVLVEESEEGVEEQVSEEAVEEIQEEQVSEEVVEEIQEEQVSEDVVEEVVEEVQEEQVSEEVVEEAEDDVESVDDLSEIKVESLEDLNELNELLVQTDTKNDEKVAEQAENIKNKIDTEKDALAKERAELEAYREQATAEIAALQAQLDEIEDAQEEVVEEKPVKKQKVFKPTFEQVVAFAKSLQEDDWKVSENIKEETGTGTIKFTKGKVQFLILQNTASDYRITFLATEKKWSTILTSIKGVSIPKNAKGNKWLKYVNKGIGETSVIKSFIREAVKGANEEIANILKAKEEEKQRKAAARKAANAKKAEEANENK